MNQNADSTRLIVLDRDGVINEDSDAFIKTVDEWHPIPGSLEAIAKLTKAGWTVVVATNQSGVGRGLFHLDTLEAIHEKMRDAVRRAGGDIAGIYFCPHHPDENCDCRKPRAGLLKRLAEDFGVSLQGVPLVGDTSRDIEAARAVGAKPILVRTGNGEKAFTALGQDTDIRVYEDLAAAADALLSSNTDKKEGELNASESTGRYFRSLLFTTILFLSVVVFAIPVALSVIVPRPWRYALVRAWVDLNLWSCRVLCGLDYTVEGTEHIPTEPSVVMWKHQSAWETIAQVQVFPTQTWVAKRELAWAPFLGWGLMALKPIIINRKAGRTAVEQVMRQGQKRLAEGLWVMIYPEGTRVPPRTTRRYGRSGALLAREAGCQIVPVAHNAGDYWPRRGLLKKPGTIRVRIGPPIETKDRRINAINADAQRWIEETMIEISPGYPPFDPEAVKRRR